jgi:hypothetical protein
MQLSACSVLCRHSSVRFAAFSYFLRRTLGCPFGQLLEGPEMKGFGRTGGHTGRLFSLGDQVQAQVALLHLSVGAELRRTKGTDRQAEMTAKAFFPINDNDPIFGPFPDRAPRAYCLTGRISAVHAGRGNAPTHDDRESAFPKANHSPPLDTRFGLMQGFTGHLAGVALDTSLRIEIKTVLLYRHRHRYLA